MVCSEPIRHVITKRMKGSRTCCSCHPEGASKKPMDRPPFVILRYSEGSRVAKTFQLLRSFGVPHGDEGVPQEDQAEHGRLLGCALRMTLSLLCAFPRPFVAHISRGRNVVKQSGTRARI